MKLLEYLKLITTKANIYNENIEKENSKTIKFQNNPFWQNTYEKTFIWIDKD